ncbi:UMP-CMP kinase 4 [Senna tora]|uniref:adenylate kinase n=1 Tax=Senna tora TaxID=362788 RepID=A0A834SE53_9FABA|nr:UMP-CMP kinase 4 [Senna tora]
MIEEKKKEGKLVPSEIVVRVIEKAMKKSKTKKFLIDGFPRNQQNVDAAENLMKIEPNMVLFFDCPKQESIRRLSSRNQGRVDDDIETIKKRLEVYYECTVPVIDYYFSKGKVRKINGGKSIEEVFEDVKSFILELSKDDKKATNK